MSKPFDVDNWLKEKEKEHAKLNYQSRAKGKLSPTIDKKAAQRNRQRNALRIGIEKVRRETGRLRPKVFLSIEFTKANEQRIKFVEEYCKQAGLSFDVVRQPKDINNRVIRTEVISRIRDATHFIGVWTPSSKGPKKNKRPSPWCVWELGIANALGLPSDILAQKGTDLVDYSVIHGTDFYYPYGTSGEFRDKIKRIINDICDVKIH